MPWPWLCLWLSLWFSPLWWAGLSLWCMFAFMSLSFLLRLDAAEVVSAAGLEFIISGLFSDALLRVDTWLPGATTGTSASAAGRCTDCTESAFCATCSPWASPSLCSLLVNIMVYFLLLFGILPPRQLLRGERKGVKLMLSIQGTSASSGHEKREPFRDAVETSAGRLRKSCRSYCRRNTPDTLQKEQRCPCVIYP